MRLDPSIDPVQLVHRLCLEAEANPETKKSRYIKRMHPITSMRKTLSVDLEAFAKEILKPHFHSGGPPKTVSSSPFGRRSTDLGKHPMTHLAARGNGVWAVLTCHLFSTLFGLLCEATTNSTAILSLKPWRMLLALSIQ